MIVLPANLHKGKSTKDIKVTTLSSLIDGANGKEKDPRILSDNEDNAITRLPSELIDSIFSKLSYHEMSRLRAVCRAFNQSAIRLLNIGFMHITRYHDSIHRQVRAQLPKRESERRYHPLSPHCDALATIETRLSLLGMTFNKYIEHRLCCFFAGKVIDEGRRTLDFIRNNANAGMMRGKFDLFRSHEVVKELRDVSAMAIEHFELEIAPRLKSRLILVPPMPDRQVGKLLASAIDSKAEHSLDDKPKDYINILRNDKVARKVKEQGKQIVELKTIVAEQTMKIRDLERGLLSIQSRMDAIAPGGGQSTRRKASSSRRGKSSRRGGSHAAGPSDETGSVSGRGRARQRRKTNTEDSQVSCSPSSAQVSPKKHRRDS